MTASPSHRDAIGLQQKMHLLHKIRSLKTEKGNYQESDSLPEFFEYSNFVCRNLDPILILRVDPLLEQK